MELERFFAVTRTSIYEVLAKGERLYPCAHKIALRGESNVDMGGMLSDQMVAIARWLQFYTPEGNGILSPLTSIERRLEEVNTTWWGSHTSAIVALFLAEEKAWECFSSPDLKPRDPRWLEETREVVNAIGENHSTITVCHFRGMDLLEQ